MYILILLSWLYLIQGIPYGIQDKFIPIQLRLQNLTFTSVSLMKGLLLPWICKGLWAPFIQVYFGPYFWLLFSVAGLGIVSFIGSLLSPGDILGIAIFLFGLNLLSAIQDIVVDGIALKSLREEQLGIGNSLQIVLYKIGSLFGGAGLLYLSNYTNWSISFLSLSAVYLFTVFGLVILNGFFKQVETKSKFDNDGSESDELGEKNKDSLKDVIAILKEVFKTKSMARFSFYIIVYKMGERAALNNFPLFLLDQGVSPNELAFWNGIIGQTLSIFGSAIGGAKLSSKVRLSNTVTFLKNCTIHRSVSLFLCYTVCKYWDLKENSLNQTSLFFYLSIFCLMYLNFVSGIISTVTFTLMMQESKKLTKDSQATHFNCLSSMEVAGKLIFSTFSGSLIEMFSINQSFMIFFILSLLPYFLL